MGTADVEPQPTWDLWNDGQQLLQFHFMQNAFEAGTIVATFAGLIGYFMVVRGQSFAGHALSQAGFPGAAGAAVAGAPPLLGLIVLCTAAALAIGGLSNRRAAERTAETASIGAILAFALALGFLFATLYQGFVDSILAFLFGAFIGISDAEVAGLLLVAAVSTATLAVIGRPLLFASVDPDVAAARGVPVRTLSLVFLVVLGFAVASAALITGTLLVFALLVTPAASARSLTARPALGLALSVGIGVAVTWLGLSIAYFTVTYPIGFVITSIAFAVFLLARGSRLIRRHVPVGHA